MDLARAGGEVNQQVHYFWLELGRLAVARDVAKPGVDQPVSHPEWSLRGIEFGPYRPP